MKTMLIKNPIIVLILALCLVRAAAGEPTSDQREMARIPPHLLSQKLTPEVIGAMQTALRTGFGQLTNSYQNNNAAFTWLSALERDHYYQSDAEFKGNIDYLTVKDVRVYGDFQVEAKNNKLTKQHYKIDYEIVLYLDQNHWTQNKEYKKDWAEDFNLDPGKSIKIKKSHDPVFRINKSNSDRPFMVVQPFLYAPPGNLFRTKYKYDWLSNSGSAWWKNKKTKSYAYLAQSPLPGIFYSQPGQAALPLEPAHMRRHISEFVIDPEYNIKVFTVQCYRKADLALLGSKTTFVHDGLENPQLQNFTLTVTSSELGIPADPDQSFEGEYFFVLGVIDKFNKMHIFEPERFIIDQGLPRVEAIVGQEIINPDYALNQTNRTIMQWHAITDQYTHYEQEADFIYVKLAGTDEPVRAGDIQVSGPSGPDHLFRVNEKSLQLNVEGDYQFDLYLVDKAGNGRQKAYQKNLTYAYYIQKPKLTLAKSEAVYRADEELVVKISDQSQQLRIKQLRLKNSTLNRALAIDLPLKLEQSIFESSLLHKKDEQGNALFSEAEKTVWLRAYQLADGSYRFNSSLSGSDEIEVRNYLLRSGYVEYRPLSELKISLHDWQDQIGGFQLAAVVEDVSGNVNDAANQLFDCQLQPAADFVFELNGQLLPEQGIGEYNLEKRLTIRVNRAAIERFDVQIDSMDLADSQNQKQLLNIQEKEVQINLRTDERLKKEQLSLKAVGYEADGKLRIMQRMIVLYYDQEAPLVSIVEQSGSPGCFELKITDDSQIGLAAIAYQELAPDNSLDLDWQPLPEKTGSGWQLHAWQSLAQSTGSWQKTEQLLPGTAACLYVVDRFGNSNSQSLNSSVLAYFHLSGGYDYVINNKQDLIDYNYEVRGDVLINCDLQIEAGETLTIASLAEKPTTLYFNSGQLERGLKLVIRGQLLLQSGFNELHLKGTAQNNRAYKWFGIQFKDNGQLSQSGTNRVTISQAIAGLSFQSPKVDISLGNMTFQQSVTAIHFIDQAAAYNRLNLSGCRFNDLVYGIKFEILPFTLLGDFEAYLQRTACEFNKIRRANVYWQSSDAE